jgi:hypothetical protein
MRKHYSNKLFQLISNLGFECNKFELKEKNSISSLETIIQVKETPLKFYFLNPNTSYEHFRSKYIPYSHYNIVTKYSPQDEWISFDGVVHDFEYWLKYHVKCYFDDNTEPNLWSQFNQANKTLNINQIDFSDKSFFSSNEIQEIQRGISELKLLIQQHLKTSKMEQKIVNEHMNYLSEASLRLNKFDWKSVAISTLISIVIALSLDTQKGQLIFDLFKKVFSSVQMLLLK